jgi:hypothetical protein
LISGLPDIEEFDMGAARITGQQISEIETLTPGAVMFTHLRYSSEFLAEIDRLNVRPFYIYRDLRDSLVSEYFHKAYLDPRLKETYPILKEVSDETAFDFDHIMKWSTVAPFYRDVASWVANSNIPSVKFENLAQQPKESFRSLLAFYGKNYSESDLDAAIAFASFQAKAGRQPGEEDRKSHYRKGIVGDWRNYFNERQHADLWNEFGDVLEQLDYAST